MNINFEEILKELEYRVEHGIIDLTKEEQVTKLKEILIENKVSNPNDLAQKARVYFSYLKFNKCRTASRIPTGASYVPTRWLFR